MAPILQGENWDFIQLLESNIGHFRKNDRVMFHRKRDFKGYDSTDFDCETFPAIASDRVKRVIKGYGDTICLITLFNLGFYEVTSM